MISLLMALGGGVFRLVPEFFKFLDRARDRDHELKMAGLQLERDKLQHAQKVEEINTQAAADYDTGALVALNTAIAAQGRPSGIAWIDAVSQSVRPVLTYWWCLVLYTTVKVAALWVLYKAHGVEPAAAIGLLWTEFDIGIVGSMINFWFLDRVLAGRPKPAPAA